MNHAVEFIGLSKSYGGVPANSQINLRVEKGSIHAIVGENGAGKSTAMKLLYGSCKPDSGQILIDGAPWNGLLKPWESPSEAIASGIGMVHQHFMLGGPYSVLDNIILGAEPFRSKLGALIGWVPAGFRKIDRKTAHERLTQLAKQYRFQIDLDAPIDSLSVGIHQKIEILKLLYRNAKILILDEPTAVLTPLETSELFQNLKKLRAEGKTVLMITHKLKEVIQAADRVTVLQRGRVVGDCPVRETNEDELATLMVGRKVKLSTAPPTGKGYLAALPASNAQPVLEISDGNTDFGHRLKDIELKVHSGEIVGIAGVEGNGQSELIQMILHAKELSSHVRGTIRILGQDARKPTDEIKAMGVGVIPEDRHQEGLLLDWSVKENFLLGLQRRKPFSSGGLLDPKALETVTKKAIADYDVRPKSIKIHVSGLSGGNQQKIIIAREFLNSPKFLIAAHPTRGVDVGAIEFIHGKILEAKQSGTGVLLISSELDEVLALSDRILVMYEGRFVGEFTRGEASEKTLGLCMGGAVPAKTREQPRLESQA